MRSSPSDKPHGSTMMVNRYVLVRRNGPTPVVQFLGMFSKSSSAKEAAGQFEDELDWSDVAGPGGALQVSEAPLESKWEIYGIVRLRLDDPEGEPVNF